MVLRLATGVCLVLVGATATGSLQTREQPSLDIAGADFGPLPETGQLIERMVERAQRQDEEEAELAYESRIATSIDTLNGDGDVTKTEHTLHRRYPVANQLFEELIERNGQPLSEDERRAELDKRERFAREARQRAGRQDERVETNDERQVRLGWELIERYEASVIGVETIDNEPCWVLDFKPRDGKFPEETRFDRALNRSSGTLYVASRDYGLRRVEFQTDRSVRYLWGLATLRHASGQLDFERVEPDVWLPKRYNFGVDVRVFFSSRRQQIARKWIERRPVRHPPIE